MYPIVAYMAMRPCLISTARRLLKVAASAPLLNPSGSQNPTGACTPMAVVEMDADADELEEEEDDPPEKEPTPVPPSTDPAPPLKSTSCVLARS
mmetsp:Transcript_10223/g.19087  ORF Transcript_10223/g.19087 Transcript_10223/m.19087 type:complete len:94 (+) Transcript_10223:356-637(+)